MFDTNQQILLPFKVGTAFPTLFSLFCYLSRHFSVLSTIFRFTTMSSSSSVIFISKKPRTDIIFPPNPDAPIKFNFVGSQTQQEPLESKISRWAKTLITNFISDSDLEGEDSETIGSRGTWSASTDTSDTSFLEEDSCTLAGTDHTYTPTEENESDGANHDYLCLLFVSVVYVLYITYYTVFLVLCTKCGRNSELSTCMHMATVAVKRERAKECTDHRIWCRWLVFNNTTHGPYATCERS